VDGRIVRHVEMLFSVVQRAKMKGDGVGPWRQREPTPATKVKELARQRARTNTRDVSGDETVFAAAVASGVVSVLALRCDHRSCAKVAALWLDPTAYSPPDKGAQTHKERDEMRWRKPAIGRRVVRTGCAGRASRLAAQRRECVGLWASADLT
jgi:hypothetical protein